MNKNQVILGAEQAVAIVKSQLPLLKAFIPAVAAAGGPIGLGIAAAAALIPLLEQIPTGEVISAEEQTKLMAEVNDIVSGKAFEGAEWLPSGFVWPTESQK